MNGATGPLAGIRILELARGIGGPLGAMWLGDMGADVLKVEWAGGDWTRRTGEAGEQALFKALNRNKRLMRMERLEPAGDLRDALAAADVIIADEDAAEVCGAFFAQPDQPDGPVTCVVRRGDSPETPRVTSELTLQAGTWPWRFIGDPGGRPLRTGQDLAGAWTAISIVQGVILGIIARKRFGKGSQITVTQEAALAAMYGYRWFWESNPTEDGWLTHSDVDPEPRRRDLYQTSDGHIMFDLWERANRPSDAKWTRLIERLGLGSYLDDERYRTVSARQANAGGWLPIIKGAVRNLSTAEFASLIEECEGYAIPANDIPALLAHPQATAMGYVQQTGLEGYATAIGPLWEFTRTPASIRLAPPLEPEPASSGSSEPPSRERWA